MYIKKTVQDRDYLLDNAKLFLIFCVVFGHIIEKYIYLDDLFRNLYIGIYMFHMPLFILISGYLSKKSFNSLEKTFIHILIPYIIFNSMYISMTSKTFTVSFFTPYWVFWYLLSLYFWKLIASSVHNIKFSVVIAFLFATFCGGNDSVGRLISMSRTIVFLPYFLIGLKIDKAFIDKIRSIPYILRIILCLTLFFVGISTFNNRNVLISMLYGADSYNSLGYNFIDGAVIRGSLLAIGTMLSILILTLIPTKKLAVTYLGARTMTIYVGHAFVLFLISDILISLTVNKYALLIICLLLSFIIISVFSNKLIVNIYNSIFGFLEKVLKG